MDLQKDIHNYWISMGERLLSTPSTQNIFTIDHAEPKHKSEALYLSRYLNKKSNVLDIGCGNGRLCFTLSKKACRVVGTELSQEVVQFLIRRKFQLGTDNVHFFQFDLLEDNLNSKLECYKYPFDLVLLFGLIIFIIDDHILLELLKSISSFLSKDGLIIMKQSTTLSINQKVLVKKVNYTGKEYIACYRSFDQIINLASKAGLSFLLKETSYKRSEFGDRLDIIEKDKDTRFMYLIFQNKCIGKCI